MKGNTLADEYAKLGVEAHGITAQHCLEIRALSKIAYHAAKWAAFQYVIMSKEEHKDSDMLQPKQQLAPGKRKRQPPQPNASRAPACDNSTQQGVGKHNVRACTVSDETTLLFCSTCGAFKWKRTSKLGASCPQHLLGSGARQRLNMIKAGRFPNSALHMTIGPHRTPTMEELRTIRATQLAHAPVINSNWKEQWSRLAQPSGSAPTRAEILTAYGQTEESIREHTVRIATADARHTPTLVST